MEEITTRSPEETQALAARLVTALAAEQGLRGTSTIVALQGDLGAGKTVFVKGVAKALGVEEMVTSPTYVIEKVYRLPPGHPWKHLIHIDAYRLEGAEELHTIGWDEAATDPGNLIMVEWPEQVGRAMPDRAYWVEFAQVDEHTRRITVDGKVPMGSQARADVKM
jgi:tRNA threonylcarbamoyladenosine biosynthesis protein TsaE